MYTWQRPSNHKKNAHLLVREDVNKDYDRKASAAKKNREPQETWRLDKLTGAKPPVVRWLWLWLAIVQGEAMHRKYKRLELGGGQAYDRSAD
jgi:hypothetical protein